MQPFRQQLPQNADTQSITCYAVDLAGKEPHWHYHEQIELVFVIKGSGQRLIGDSIGRFNTGQLLLLGKDLPHDFNPDDNESPCNLLVVHFYSELFNNFAELKLVQELVESAKQGLMFNSMPVRIYELLDRFDKLDTSSQLIKALDILHELSKHSLIDKPLKLSSVEFTKSKLEHRSYEKLNKVLTFINENKQNTLSVDDVSSFSNMTTPAFCRWFKKSMSVSFLTYLNNIRIEDACRLLLKSDLQIGQIAIETGFESFSSFNRNFVKLKKKPPSEYRKSLSTKQ